MSSLCSMLFMMVLFSQAASSVININNFANASTYNHWVSATDDTSGLAYVTCSPTNTSTLFGQHFDNSSLEFTITLYSSWLAEKTLLRFTIAVEENMTHYESKLVELNSTITSWYFLQHTATENVTVILNVTQLTIQTSTEEWSFSYLEQPAVWPYCFLVVVAALLNMCLTVDRSVYEDTRNSRLYVNRKALLMLIAKIDGLFLALCLTTIFVLEEPWSILYGFVAVSFFGVYTCLFIYTMVLAIVIPMETYPKSSLVLTIGLILLEVLLFPSKMYALLSVLAMMGLQLKTKYSMRSNYLATTSEKIFAGNYFTWLLLASGSFFFYWNFFRIQPHFMFGISLIVVSALAMAVVLLPKRRQRRFVSDGSRYFEQCCICLDEIADDELLVTDCNHGFHFECMRKWQVHSNLCPLDREFIMRRI